MRNSVKFNNNSNEEGQIMGNDLKTNLRMSLADKERISERKL